MGNGDEVRPTSVAPGPNENIALVVKQISTDLSPHIVSTASMFTWVQLAGAAMMTGK